MALQEFDGELDPTSYNDPRLDAYAREAAVKRGLDPDILVTIKNQGERSNPTAVSPKGARGVMQLMPGTWKAYGKGHPDDPYASIDAAGDFLKTELYPKYKTNKAAMLAHYNGGVKAGEAILAGLDAPYAETRNYLNRAAPKGGLVPFEGQLDSDNGLQEFTGELDKPETPEQPIVLDQPATSVASTPVPALAPKSTSMLDDIGAGLKDIWDNPGTAAKMAASSGAKIVDLAGSVGSMAAGYLGGGAAGLISGDLDVAKKVKDEIMGKLSLDKQLQKSGLAIENAEPFTGALDTVIGKPAEVIAHTVAPTPGFVQDVVKDVSMAALPYGLHKGSKALAERSVPTPEVPKAAPDVVTTPKLQEFQGELDLGEAPQAGPIQPGAGLIKNTETIPAIQDLANQARMDLVQPDFQNAQKAFGQFDDAVAKTEANRPEITPDQLQLFEGKLDQENPAYPNQTPRLDEVVPEMDTRTMEQNNLFLNPLDDLVRTAREEASPEPYAPPTPEQLAQQRMERRINAAREEPIDLPGRKQSQIPLDLSTPDYVSYQLDRAAEDIQGRGTQNLDGTYNLAGPTKEDFQTKKDLPMVMSPQKVVETMGVTATNLKPPPAELVRSISPNWAKRDTWNEHPILRSTFDNLNHLRDERNAWLKDIVEPKRNEEGVLVKPTQYLDSLDGMERREQAHYTTKYEGETTPAMKAEGRNFFNYEEWRERGASDRVAKALVEGSDIYQKSLEKYNAEAKMLGEKPIAVIPNYFPHRHMGDFFVEITDKRNGQKEIFPFQTLADAKKATRDISPSVDRSTHHIDYGRKQRGGNDFKDLMDALRSRSETFHGTSPSGFTTMLDSMRKSMDEAFFAGKERRTGAGHYTGEQGYDLNASKALARKQKEEVRFVTDSPVKYATDMSNYLLDRKATGLKEAYQKAAEDNGFAHTGAWSETKRVMDKQTSLYTDPVFDSSKSTFIEDAADSVAKLLDRNSAIEGHAPVSWLTRRALVSRMHNLNRTATNLLLHPVLNSALTASQFAQFMTSPINVVSQISRALAKNEAPSGFIEQLKHTGKTPAVIGEAFAKGVWDVMAPEKLKSESGKSALAWAKQHGHLDSMFSHEHLDSKGRAKRAIKLEGLTVASEQYPRSMTFLAGYNAFRRLGFSDMAAKKASVEFANTIMGDYTKEGKIEFIREQSPLVGTAISPFSTWMWNAKAQVGALATSLGSHGAAKNFVTGTVVPLAALVGATTAFTGWSGMPGVQDYDNIVKWINETYNTELATSSQVNLEHGADIFGSDKAANVGYYGALPEATGRDTAKSIRYGSILDFGAPGVSYATSLGKAGYQLGKKGLSELGLVETPTDADLYKAVKSAAPPGTKTLVEDYFAKDRQDGGKALKSGIIRKEGESTKAMILPFGDLSEKKQQDVNNTANYVKARQNKLADRQLELIKDKALRNEDVSSNFKQLIDLNPDYAKHPVSVVQSVVQEAMKRQLSQQEFEALKAARNQSLNDKQDAARRKQYMERVLNAK